MPNWGVISGGVLVLIGAVLVAIGQRLSQDFSTLYAALRRRVSVLRQRLPIARRARARRGATPQQGELPTLVLQQSAPVSTDVGRVIGRLQQGTLTATEKQHLAAALLSAESATARDVAVGSLDPALPLTSNGMEEEALTLATVASTAVQRIGQRGVLAVRVAGIVVTLAGIGLALIGVLYR